MYTKALIIFQKIKKMIQENRKPKLLQISKYISDKILQKEHIHLIFICIQNSRRSHLAQVIAADAAYQHGLNNKVITTHSGGVEVTRIHPNTVKCLEALNYQIKQMTFNDNPIFDLFIKPQYPAIKLYSKNFEEVTHQLNKFMAIMVCSETETNCPYVPGAEKIIHLPYNDPKIADDTSYPLSEYINVAKQIQSEMHFVFSNIKQSV